jgi:hypothetical protein
LNPIDSLEPAAVRAATERARVAALPLDGLNPADPQGFVDDTVGYLFEPSPGGSRSPLAQRRTGH